MREEPELDLSEVTIWDLMACWSKLLREIEASRPHQVSHDPRPLRWYVSRVVDRLKTAERTTLRSLLDGFDEGPKREGLVGSFCALLELCKLGLIAVQQEGVGADIELARTFDDAAQVDAILSDLVMDDELEEEGESPSEEGVSGEVEAQNGAH